MNGEYQIKEERVISDEWGKLQSVDFEVMGKDGKMHAKTQELYNPGNAVAVLLYNKDQRSIIVGRQFRIATVYNGNQSGMLTEVCAGKIEDGLSPDETVRKEILEETGYEVKTVEKVMTLFTSPGAFTEQLHLYIAAYNQDMKKEAGGGRNDEQENIEVEELSFDKALQMVRAGGITDAKTIILLQYAALNDLM